MEQDSEYLLLESIKDLGEKQESISQRDLSREVQLSLGMTNVILKRLAEKGLIRVRRVSSRTVTYVLTPEGLNELARRTWRSLKRTIKKVSDCRDQVQQLVETAAATGHSQIILLGDSDLDFIVEYAAARAGLHFTTVMQETQIPADAFVFVSENWKGSWNQACRDSTTVYTLLTGEKICAPMC
ncbi:MAG: winged helix-turn-helix transcriptional regulator [Spirochaetales bacterium]|nr:winged helix-turn-helix transcriptional regulator [Spirochaetales bacterium]